MITRKLLDYDLEVLDIADFKSYYKENLDRFNGFSKKAFLKSVDIPAPYFLEQPDDTQETLLDNKEVIIKNANKYSDKVLIMLVKDNVILNACRMSNINEELSYDQLSTITDVENIIWNKTYHKDGYIQGYILRDEVKKDQYNRCTIIDFPIMLNKPVIIHDGFYKMPTETSLVDNDSFYYISSTEVDFMDYQHVAVAIECIIEDMDIEIKSVTDNPRVSILRENEDVVTALLGDKIIPKTIILGVLSALNKRTEFETLTHASLVEILLAFEGNLKNIKQVTNLRNCYNFIKDVYASDREEKEELVASSN